MKIILLFLSINLVLSNIAKAGIEEANLTAPKPESFCKSETVKQGNLEFKSIKIVRGKCEIDEDAYLRALRSHYIQKAKQENVIVKYKANDTQNALDVRTIKAENSIERSVASFMNDKLTADLDEYKKSPIIE